MSAAFRSAVAAGKLRRARHFMRDDGRTLLVALDHAAYLGTGPPRGESMQALADGRPDGILATWEVARTDVAAFADAGLVLRLDGGTSELTERDAGDVSTLLYRAEQALAIGADAVVVLVFPGAPDEHRSLQRLAGLCAECELLGLPVMAESIPGGWQRAVPWTVDNVGRAARICAELGADIVKTGCPGPTEEFAAITDACPVPVVALGGPKMATEDDVVAVATGVVRAGAAGIAFGRNCWGSADPAKLLARLHEAVHAS
jgi:class I fructose-bisphosphate aldolase/fructose-bisphosphate aldolase/2-amino-3,7-dideoxy-D-threo-hept-6-ulosonate synthase